MKSEKVINVGVRMLEVCVRVLCCVDSVVCETVCSRVHEGVDQKGVLNHTSTNAP